MQVPLKGFWPTTGVFTLVVGLFNPLSVCGQPVDGPSALIEEFENISTLESGWVEVISGDFDTAIIEVTNSPAEGKLRLGVSTLETDPRTVKLIGVRSLEPVKLKKPYQVSWALDWNDQSNGSYLSAGVLISPHATRTKPTTESDWLQVSYVGVPPGVNARLEITGRVSGQRKTFYTEGWPAENRAGRKIGLQHLDLQVSDSGLELKENGKFVFRTDQALPFQQVYVYLFLTSHSNYKLRDIYFERVEVKETN